MLKYYKILQGARHKNSSCRSNAPFDLRCRHRRRGMQDKVMAFTRHALSVVFQMDLVALSFGWCSELLGVLY
jgi:hypothetical protein